MIFCTLIFGFFSPKLCVTTIMKWSSNRATILLSRPEPARGRTASDWCVSSEWFGMAAEETTGGNDLSSPVRLRSRSQPMSSENTWRENVSRCKDSSKNTLTRTPILSFNPRGPSRKNGGGFSLMSESISQSRNQSIRPHSLLRSLYSSGTKQKGKRHKTRQD